MEAIIKKLGGAAGNSGKIAYYEQRKEISLLLPLSHTNFVTTIFP